MTKMRLLAAAAAAVSVPAVAQAQLDLTVFHNNDGESALLPTAVNGVEVGGAARFKSLLDARRAAVGNSIFVSSGDNFLASPVVSVTQQTGEFYDAQVINALGYDALTLGNHDFDFGPSFLADFVGAVDASVPFLSANLDFTGEPALQALVDSGRIRPSTVVTIDGTGEEVGLIGLTTPDLPIISNPGNVTANADLAGVVQGEVDRLTAQGVDNIVLVSHLQSINNEISLAGMVRGVDAIVGGGGDELLIGSNPVAPGDELLNTRPYPIVATDLDGNPVPVVTTTGQYKYLGQLDLRFDAAGTLDAFGGDAYRVVDQSLPDGVAPDANVETNILDPLRDDLARLNTVLATSEVRLDGTRERVRTQETNYGDLIADAILDAGQDNSATFGVDAPVVALTNGGGIRNSVVIPAGDEITQLAVDTTLPFGNEVTVIEDVPVEVLLQVLERAVSAVEFTSGRFAQISGFSFTYDPEATAAEFAFDDSGNVTGVVEPGERIVDVFLDGAADDVQIVDDGEVVMGFEGLLIDVATVDFLANGGDGYPFEFFGLMDTPLGVTYAQALAGFLTRDLQGVVPAALYPEGGLGRIAVIPEPASLLAGAAVAGLLSLRRRK